MKKLLWLDGNRLEDPGLIDRFEAELSVSLPQEYRQCAAAHDGARPSKELFRTENGAEHVFLALIPFKQRESADMWSMNSLYDGRYLQFATDYFGNGICFDTRDDSVVFIDHEDGSADRVADSFDKFLALLRDEEE